MLNKAFDRLIVSFAIFAGVLFVFSVVTTCLEIILRYFFLRPTNLFAEINEYILYVAPFMAAAWILKERGHVRMDLIVNMLSGSKRVSLDVCTSFMGAIICIILVWFGAAVTLESFQTGHLTDSGLVRFNRGYFQIFSVVGLLMLAIEFIRQGMFHFRSLSAHHNGDNI